LPSAGVYVDDEQGDVVVPVAGGHGGEQLGGDLLGCGVGVGGGESMPASTSRSRVSVSPSV